jgi:competence protein ComEA
MNRTGWLGVVAPLLVGGGGVGQLAWPSHEPALRCAPEAVRWDSSGVARCASGSAPGAVPWGAALTLGVPLSLNRATVQDLLLLPGIGPSLASKLIAARDGRGGFTDWEQVDAVPGVGASKLSALQRAARIP